MTQPTRRRRVSRGVTRRKTRGGGPREHNSALRSLPDKAMGHVIDSIRNYINNPTSKGDRLKEELEERLEMLFKLHLIRQEQGKRVNTELVDAIVNYAEYLYALENPGKITKGRSLRSLKIRKGSGELLSVPEMVGKVGSTPASRAISVDQHIKKLKDTIEELHGIIARSVSMNRTGMSRASASRASASRGR